jgi:hypothetical protein
VGEWGSHIVSWGNLKCVERRFGSCATLVATHRVLYLQHIKASEGVGMWHELELADLVGCSGLRRGFSGVVGSSHR